MTDQEALFGPTPTVESVAPRLASEPDSLPAWQVSQLRRALDACGIGAVAERKRLVEEIVGRPLAHLRELRSTEARDVLVALSRRDRDRSRESQEAGSAWDDREEDTWIDKL